MARAMDGIAWGSEGEHARHLTKPNRPLAQRRRATNLDVKGLGWTTLRKVKTADQGSCSERILPTRKWGCKG
jgi:hypothetical protein